MYTYLCTCACSVSFLTRYSCQQHTSPPPCLPAHSPPPPPCLPAHSCYNRVGKKSSVPGHLVVIFSRHAYFDAVPINTTALWKSPTNDVYIFLQNQAYYVFQFYIRFACCHLSGLYGSVLRKFTSLVSCLPLVCNNQLMTAALCALTLVDCVRRLARYV